MGTPRLREESFHYARFFQDQGSRCHRQRVIVVWILLASFAGCSNADKGTNSNSAAGNAVNANSNSNTSSSATAAPLATIDFKEPERYSMSMTISAQAVAEAPSSMATQQFGFAKLGSDRKWSFALPAPLGHVTYLEKSGLKYLVFADRNQYLEVAPDALGFQPSGVLTPIAVAQKLNPRSQYEQLGLEPINARTAMKYRITSDADGTRKIDGVIFVDQETGLPLRYELTAVPTPGTNLRVIVEARDVRLSPDQLQFDVPAGMRKITAQEAKSQIEAFAGSLRSFSDILSGKITMPSAANAVPSTSNKNAGSRTR